MDQGDNVEAIDRIISNLKNIISKCKSKDESSLPPTTKLDPGSSKSQTQFYTALRSPSSISSQFRLLKKSKSASSLSKRDLLVLQIEEAATENFNLRDSNVKLQRQFKLQDTKIRDLKYKISLQGQKIFQQQADLNTVSELENTVRSKRLEMEKLRHEVQKVTKEIKGEVKVEWISSKRVQSTPVINTKDKLLKKTRRDIKTAVNSDIRVLLSELNILLRKISQVSVAKDIATKEWSPLYIKLLKDAQIQIEGMLKAISGVECVDLGIVIVETPVRESVNDGSKGPINSGEPSKPILQGSEKPTQVEIEMYYPTKTDFN